MGALVDAKEYFNNKLSEQPSLYRSKLIAARQKNRAKYKDICKMLNSSVFKSKYKKLSGEHWTAEKELEIAQDFLGMVALIVKSFQWSGEYGKHFSYQSARKAYRVCRDVYGFSSSEAIEQAFDKAVAGYRLALPELTELCPTSRRRVLQALATPDWREPDRIKMIYAERDALNAVYGPRSHHVDHIIPINHELVCGLHVHQNLRIVTEEENCKKKNFFDIESA